MEGDLLPLMHMEIIGRDPRKYYEDLDVATQHNRALS